MSRALELFIVLVFSLLVSGCSESDGPGSGDGQSENRREHGREAGHDREGGEHGRERGHDGEGGEHGRDGGHDGEGGEHGREGGHDGEGEEDGTELALDATYDKVRHGARLILAYEAASNSFVGTVHNDTEKTLEAVRVEVHLSNGKELGPTPAADLAPGQQRPVRLTAESTGFDGWTAHPEVGRGEHGHQGAEGHDNKGRADRGRGEHK